MCMALVILAGCAGEQSRTVAMNTLKIVTDYERQLDQKIKAEKTFYAEQLVRISDGMEGKLPGGIRNKWGVSSDKTEEDSTDETAGSSVKRSWLYGYLRTTMDRKSLIAAGQIMAAKESEVFSLVTKYLSDGLESDRAALMRVRMQRRALAEKAATALEPVEKQKKRLVAIRKDLTLLATKPADKAKLDQIKAIASIIIKEIKTNREGTGS